MNSELELQKRMVEYLESVHMGECIGKTMAEVAEDIQEATDNDPSRSELTIVLPKPVSAECSEDCCDHLCNACKAALSWWNGLGATVNELLFKCNVHSCNKGCKNNKHKICKARFPRKVLLETPVDPETGALNLKKGEAMLNTFSPILTFLMRCDSDVTSLLSDIAIKFVIAYMTDYITKTLLKTHTMFEAVKTIFR